MKKKLICALLAGLFVSPIATTTVFASDGNLSSSDYTNYLYEKYNGNWSLITEHLIREHGTNFAFAFVQQMMKEIAEKEKNDALDSIKENQELMEKLIERMEKHKQTHGGKFDSDCEECDQLSKELDEFQNKNNPDRGPYDPCFPQLPPINFPKFN